MTRSGRLMLRTGTQVAEWDRGDTRMEHVYTGPRMELGVPFNFGALQVLLAPLGAENINVASDGFEIVSETMNQSEVYAMPQWGTGQVFQWTLRGTARVSRVSLAPSIKEL